MTKQIYFLSLLVVASINQIHGQTIYNNVDDAKTECTDKSYFYVKVTTKDSATSWTCEKCNDWQKQSADKLSCVDNAQACEKQDCTDGNNKICNLADKTCTEKEPSCKWYESLVEKACVIKTCPTESKCADSENQECKPLEEENKWECVKKVIDGEENETDEQPNGSSDDSNISPSDSDTEKECTETNYDTCVQLYNANLALGLDVVGTQPTTKPKVGVENSDTTDALTIQLPIGCTCPPDETIKAAEEVKKLAACPSKCKEYKKADTEKKKVTATKPEGCDCESSSTWRNLLSIVSIVPALLFYFAVM